MIWFISQDSSVNPLDAFPSPHNSRLRESLSTNSDACLLHTGATQPVLAVQCLASCLFQPKGTNAESAQGRSPENHVYHKVLLVKCRSFIETKSLERPEAHTCQGFQMNKEDKEDQYAGAFDLCGNLLCAKCFLSCKHQQVIRALLPVAQKQIFTSRRLQRTTVLKRQFHFFSPAFPSRRPTFALALRRFFL